MTTTTTTPNLVHDDHGVQWHRKNTDRGVFEFARLSHHALIVTPPVPGRSGFGWAVVPDGEQQPVNSGKADTRPEARMCCVMALAEAVGALTITPEPEQLLQPSDGGAALEAPTRAWPLPVKLFAAASLAVILAGFLGIIVAAVLS